ncbi:MAG: NADH:ubiquinone oxidoreductase [Paracoccaceae bacterium]|nr:NADH:ubiquinone oxidoreductase [Paracoccaceae bacterium]
MSRHTQGSLAIVGAIASGIFLVALVALMVMGDFAFSPALFLALVVALVATIVLYRGFQTPAQPSTHVAEPVAPAPAPAPEPAAEAEPEPEPEPAPEPEAAPEPQAAPEPEAEAVAQAKPALLEAPPEGGPDDLKKIKGVGPKLEEFLHGMGVYQYSQIASWTDGEVAWVDENLEGINKGRVSRDGWVDQAKTLASGGETEFSKKVDDGDVY